MQIEKTSLYKIKVVLIYLLLGFGGLWNYLGWFSGIMANSSGLMIVLISFYILYESLIKKVVQGDSSISNTAINYKHKMLIYFVLVVLISWLIEFAGVKTGAIFGHYNYGLILMPQIYDVPIAIGFAWFSTLIISTAIIQTFTKINLRLVSSIKKALIIGLLMTIFDYVLEIAAIKLGYWSWQFGLVPFQNYLAWFFFGSSFAYMGFKTNILDIRLPKIIFHLYFAQIIFFILSSI